MYVAVGPEIAPAAEGLAALALIALCVVMIGLQRGWSATLGAFLRAFADALDIIRLPGLLGGGHVLGPVSAFLRRADKDVHSLLGRAASQCEAGAAWLWNQTATQILWLGREIADLSQATFHAFGNVSVTVVKPAVKILDAKTQKQVNALIGRLARLSQIVTAKTANAIRLLDRHIAHAVAIPAHAIAGLRTRVGKTEKQLRREARRIGKLEAATVGLGAAALVGTALARLGVSWIRCNNWKRLGREVCQADSDLISSLLADAALLTVAFNIEEFARELQAVVGLAAHAIQDFAE